VRLDIRHFRGSCINLAASPLGAASVNWIWAPVGSEVIWTWSTNRHQAHNSLFRGSCINL